MDYGAQRWVYKCTVKWGFTSLENNMCKLFSKLTIIKLHYCMHYTVHYVHVNTVTKKLSNLKAFVTIRKTRQIFTFQT